MLKSPTRPGRQMGRSGEPESEHSLLLLQRLPDCDEVPEDTWHLAYIIYFTLGVGLLVPWNAFITAVDYFTYFYPGTHVDRIIAVAYMVVVLLCLLVIIFFGHKSDAYARMNVGLALSVVGLLVVPLMDAVYVKGRVGLYFGFHVTVGAVVVSSIGDAFVQSALFGAAGELPERYMQATVAGTAGSGVLVSFLRIFTKAAYPQDAHGLRKSTNLYFGVGIAVMVICIVFYNVVHRLPVIRYYTKLKIQAVNEEKEAKGSLTAARWRSTFFEVAGCIKWHGIGIIVIYIVTLAIFPGYITEDVHSEFLKDWYPILLIAGCNIFDLIGKSLTSVYLLENAKVAIGGCFARLLFFPLFLGCLHGSKFFCGEIPVTILTCLFGLTDGYFTSVLMILAPKVVPLQHAETAGIVVVLFLFVGLATGSVVSWFWVI